MLHFRSEGYCKRIQLRICGSANTSCGYSYRCRKRPDIARQGHIRLGDEAVCRGLIFCAQLPWVDVLTFLDWGTSKRVSQYGSQNALQSEIRRRVSHVQGGVHRLQCFCNLCWALTAKSNIAFRVDNMSGCIVKVG